MTNTEEHEYFTSLERTWKKSMSQLTFYQLLEVFPDAKSAIKRNLINQINQCKKDLILALELERSFNKNVTSRVKYKNKFFVKLVCDIFITQPLRNGKEQIIKRNNYYLSFLKKEKHRIHTTNISQEDIERVKMIPLNTIITVNNADFAHCPFHEDKTPSFKVYKKKNRWYCFSCHGGGDIIDITQKFHQCDFVSAVKLLLKK